VIEFTDSIAIPEIDNAVECRYKLSASEPDALPRKADVEVLKGLVSLTHRINEFEDFRVVLRIETLLEALRAFSEDDLVESIQRWFNSGLRIEYKMRSGGHRFYERSCGIIDSFSHGRQESFMIDWSNLCQRAFRGDYRSKVIPAIAERMLTPYSTKKSRKSRPPDASI
jgi:hypothetical protein